MFRNKIAILGLANSFTKSEITYITFEIVKCSLSFFLRRCTANVFLRGGKFDRNVVSFRTVFTNSCKLAKVTKTNNII